jgi:hypothetical protein
MKRIINLKGLNDGTGRVCVHWFVEGSGPIHLTGHPQLRAVTKQGTNIVGHIACNPDQNSLNPVVRNGETLICSRSEDPRAVTCPKCKESADAVMAALQNHESGLDEKARGVIADAEAAHASAVAMMAGS